MNHADCTTHELAALLRDVYNLTAPQMPEVPAWDPPVSQDFLVSENPPEPTIGEDRAEFFEREYRATYELAQKLFALASDLDDKLRELETVTIEDHHAVCRDLSSRAWQVRVDLERWGLPLPLPRTVP